MRAWLLAMAILLAGCGTPDEGASPGPSGGSTPTPTPEPSPGGGPPDTAPNPELTELAWEIRDCFFIYGQPSALASAVRDDLPEGFSIGNDAAGRVSVGFETNECASGTGLIDTVEPQTYASVWVPAAPPAELAAEAGAGHFVNFDVLVEDQQRRIWMEQRGVPAHDGSITRSDIVDGSFTVEWVMDGVGTISFLIAQIQPVGDGGGAFDQWTPGDDGLTYWRTDWQTQGQFQGVGIIEIEPSMRYSDWFETSAVPATFNFGTWDYTDGRIVHPAPLA